ncbi:hypothetical protein CROQUDRAFT_12108, partial [Cronartium quercuum f. sp. fusiforme G11]
HPGQRPKDLQVKPIVSFINRFTTFLLAGTGFGKILYCNLFLISFMLKFLPMIIILNCLDTLRDNQ